MGPDQPCEPTTEYDHKEAFNLMQYQCEKCNHYEILWNSRDGVTPFCLACPKCDALEMQHIRWGEDIKAPDFTPIKGMRIFVDLTEKKLRGYMIKRVDSLWDNAEYPASERWNTKEEAIESLMESERRDGAPDVVTIEEGPEMADFHKVENMSRRYRIRRIVGNSSTRRFA